MEGERKRRQRSRTRQMVEQGAGGSPSPPLARPAPGLTGIAHGNNCRTQVNRRAKVAPLKLGNAPKWRNTLSSFGIESSFGTVPGHLLPGKVDFR